MTTKASCLCGTVRFQFEQAIGPFEICHCNRCRKLSGAQGMPGIAVSTKGYTMTAGADSIQTYTAPLLNGPPAYHSRFCKNCGSPVPEPHPSGDSIELPAGLLDDDPGIAPDKHIFVEFVPPWDKITDGLPEYDVRQLAKERYDTDLPKGFTPRSHYDV